MKLSDFYRNGKRYDGRPETFVKRIVDGGLFELTDNNGYLEIFEVTIYFKNGTEQKYNRDKLKFKKWTNALLTDLDTLATSGGLRGKAQIELWGSMKEWDDGFTYDWTFADLHKTDHFGGRGASGQKVNKGEKYERELADSFFKYGDDGGRYPEHVKKILKAICKKNQNKCFKSAKHVGGVNAPRPMKEKNGAFYISAGGADKKDIGSTLTDITLTIGAAKGGSDQPIYLSVKFGDTLSFFNVGVRGPRDQEAEGLRIFPLRELENGELTDLGKRYLDMFNIDHSKFIDVFSKYDKDNKSPTVADHRSSYQIQGQAKKDLENFCASGVGYGYWMVHYTGTDLQVYEVDEQYMKSASTLTSNDIGIDYGGAGGAGKRIDINFQTKEYDFKFNIRSKSGGETYPTHSNGDYFKR